MPEKSFVKWAVEQGFTVFLVSWVNPDAPRAERLRGLHARRDRGHRRRRPPDRKREDQCARLRVGGTLLATALAYLAAKADDCVASATFLAAQVDFSEAGDLFVFIDDTQLKALEEMMAEQGYLDGSRMAQSCSTCSARVI